MNEMSTEMGRMGCQYECMMRMSQPGSDDSTIMSLVNYHDYMMTGFEQTMDMCDGMEVIYNLVVLVWFHVARLQYILPPFFLCI